MNTFTITTFVLGLATFAMLHLAHLPVLSL